MKVKLRHSVLTKPGGEGGCSLYPDDRFDRHIQPFSILGDC